MVALLTWNQASVDFAGSSPVTLTEGYMEFVAGEWVHKECGIGNPYQIATGVWVARSAEGEHGTLE